MNLNLKQNLERLEFLSQINILYIIYSSFIMILLWFLICLLHLFVTLIMHILRMRVWSLEIKIPSLSDRWKNSFESRLVKH